MNLKEVKPGTKVRITDMEPSALKQRLLSMGLVKGSAAEVLRLAPFGDPMVISIRSYVLSLRLADAEKIKVELV